MTDLTTEPQVAATIDLVFALRDSLTDDGPSRLDFWSGGRAATALLTAAAGAATGAQAVSIAARKLQIRQYATSQAATVQHVAATIDRDLPGWARMVETEIQYVIALADIRRQTSKKTKTIPATEEPTF